MAFDISDSDIKPTAAHLEVTSFKWISLWTATETLSVLNYYYYWFLRNLWKLKPVKTLTVCATHSGNNTNSVLESRFFTASHWNWYYKTWTAHEMALKE